ncbi:hypothetical protein GCM10010339_48830 [Streptomyces alanosinicus]|uniref:Uncharacterized protein n=1 Tax=Streptomyces alanosinicus TaxID=68171 RepID=A0A918YLF6_9ACTN|nr:hypothetical protein GCM10010339_48830 [Streptomyces alanosinicus]
MARAWATATLPECLKGLGAPPVLAAGQLAGPQSRVAGRPDQGEQQLHAFFAFTRAGPAQPQQLALRRLPQLPPVHLDPPPVGCVEAADDVQQGGLAGSGAPLERDEFTPPRSRETPRRAWTAAGARP